MTIQSRLEELDKNAASLTALLSAPLSIMCAGYTTVVLLRYVEKTTLLAWAISVIVISLFRILLILRIRARKSTIFSFLLNYLCLFAQGVLWGGCLFLITEKPDIYVSGIMTLIMMGISIGVMFMKIGYTMSWTSLSVPAMGGHLAYLLLIPGDGHVMFAATMVIFYVIGTFIAVRLKKFLQTSQDFQASLQQKNAEILEKNQTLYKIAHFDSLTGAANRKFLRLQSSKYIEDIKNSDVTCAFFLIDLDNFKHLNDTMGHAAGDALLRVVTARLRQCVKGSDVVARLGGDEFGLFIKDLKTTKVLDQMARRVLSILDKPITYNGNILNCRGSIGISVYPDHGQEISQLMHNADLALQHVKKQGKGNYQYCTRKLRREAETVLNIESDLIRALKQDAITFHFQPIVRASDHVISGAEALMRFEMDPPLAATPHDVLTVAQTVGRSDELSKALFMQLEREAPRLFETLPALEKVSLNLSPQELRSLKPVDRLQEIFRRGTLHPKQIQIEITEQSVLERGADRARQAIDQLASLGLSVVMDDFGTGYSSLTHLKTLPITGVKIDKSFVADVAEDARDAAIVRSIIGMCKGLGIDVTAEGVETYAQYEILQRLGCDFIQGYLFFSSKSVDDWRQSLADIPDGTVLAPLPIPPEPPVEPIVPEKPVAKPQQEQLDESVFFSQSDEALQVS